MEAGAGLLHRSFLFLVLKKSCGAFSANPAPPALISAE